MRLDGLLAAALGDPALAAARELARRGGPAAEQVDLTAPPSLRAFIIAAIAGNTAAAGDGAPGGPVAAGRPVLAVTATSREAEDLVTALGELLPPDQVAAYPAWE